MIGQFVTKMLQGLANPYTAKNSSHVEFRCEFSEFYGHAQGLSEEGYLICRSRNLLPKTVSNIAETVMTCQLSFCLGGGYYVIYPK